MIGRAVVVIVVAVVLVGSIMPGCVTPHAPVPAVPPATHEWPGVAAALRAIAARQRQLVTFAGPCAIMLESADGGSVRLEGEIAARRPDRYRARFRKIGRVVLDVTVREDGVWVYAAEGQGQGRGGADLADVPAAHFGRTASFLLGDFFERDLRVEHEDGATLTVSGAEGPGRVFCTIDRATQTPRRYRIVDDGGRERFVLDLERYTERGAIAWPLQVAGTARDGRFVLDLGEVRVNPELPAAAFEPPRRAIRRP